MTQGNTGYCIRSLGVRPARLFNSIRYLKLLSRPWGQHGDVFETLSFFPNKTNLKFLITYISGLIPYLAPAPGEGLEVVTLGVERDTGIRQQLPNPVPRLSPAINFSRYKFVLV